MSKLWSDEDTAALAVLVRRGVAYSHISRELGRTIGSIKARVLKLFPGGRQPPSKTYWTPEEEAILTRCRRQGLSYAKCSRELAQSGFNRSAPACEVRWRAELNVAPRKDDVSAFEKQDRKFQNAMRKAIAAGLECPRQYEISRPSPINPVTGGGPSYAQSFQDRKKLADGRETSFCSWGQSETEAGARSPMGGSHQDDTVGQGADAFHKPSQVLERAS